MDEDTSPVFPFILGLIIGIIGTILLLLVAVKISTFPKEVNYSKITEYMVKQNKQCITITEIDKL